MRKSKRLTFKEIIADSKRIHKAIMKSINEIPYKKMSKKMMQATIDANGGEERMRKLLGMK